jgi:3-(3-hydroxy-phenyl)propionate hydroxylase
MLLEHETPASFTEPDRVWKLLERWILPSQGTLERAATYGFHSLISQEWRRGRLFIAGDAAHLTPPFLGQGLCAAARDAANLAWKLTLAVRDPASAPVLDTYGPERRPHVREFIALAVQMGNIIQETNPKTAAARDTELKAKGLSFKFPRPTLGPGVHTNEGGEVGKVFCQSILPDGRWLDDVVGQNFALIIDSTHASELTAELDRKLTDLGIVVIRNGGIKAQRWFIEHGEHAVLLRPNRYIFNTLDNLSQLPAALAALQAWLRPESSAVPSEYR